MSKRRSTRSRDDDSSKRRRTQRLDPLALTRGMSARYLGARSRLSALTAEEVDRDLRHMEAYQNACIAYAQQYFIFSNRNLVQSGHYGRGGSTRSDVFMPVRIDPEEEKRLSLLRKRIATSERQREVLETEYVSLRAAYVYESQALDKARKTVDGQLRFLQELVEKHSQVVALQRTRVSMARDVLACLQKRNGLAQQGKSLPNTESADIGSVWNNVELQLAAAERACRSLKVPKELRDVKKDNCMQWDARTLPRTPYGIPIYLSQLSSAPDKGAAFGCGGIFGSQESSMAWLQSNLPRTLAKMNREQLHVQNLQQDSCLLQTELKKERRLNKELQDKIAKRRHENDEMCALASMLRSETEAVLSRHNILLDTPEARTAAKALHKKVAATAKEQQKLKDAQASEQGDSGEVDENDESVPVKAAEENADLDNDGDDEGDDDDDLDEKHGDEMFD